MSTGVLSRRAHDGGDDTFSVEKKRRKDRKISTPIATKTRTKIWRKCIRFLIIILVVSSILVFQLGYLSYYHHVNQFYQNYIGYPETIDRGSNPWWKQLKIYNISSQKQPFWANVIFNHNYNNYQTNLIIEWIEHHLRQGLDKIFYFDDSLFVYNRINNVSILQNNSSYKQSVYYNYSYNLLRPYIDAGLIQYYSFPYIDIIGYENKCVNRDPDIQHHQFAICQDLVMNFIRQRLYKKHKHIMYFSWIDIDEFIYVKDKHITVIDLLNDYFSEKKRTGTKSIQLECLKYGTSNYSNNTEYANIGVIQSHLYRAPYDFKSEKHYENQTIIQNKICKNYASRFCETYSLPKFITLNKQGGKCSIHSGPKPLVYGPHISLYCNHYQYLNINDAKKKGWYNHNNDYVVRLKLQTYYNYVYDPTLVNIIKSYH